MTAAIAEGHPGSNAAASHAMPVLSPERLQQLETDPPLQEQIETGAAQSSSARPSAPRQASDTAEAGPVPHTRRSADEPLPASASTEKLEHVSSFPQQEASKVTYSIDSTCAASTLSGGTSSNSNMIPLLKASPPVPVGRIAGRFKVRLWRLSSAQPYGVSFGNDKGGSIVVAEDAPHLALRRGDEVVGINGQAVTSIRQCREVLSNSKEMELHLYHHELPKEIIERQSVFGNCIETRDMPVCCDACFNPPEPRCRSRSFPLRDLLLSTGPVPIDANGLFSLTLVRASRKQPFGLAIGSLPIENMQQPPAYESSFTTVFPLPASNSFASSVDWETQEAPAAPRESEIAVEQEPVAMFVKEALPHLGLLEGDEILQVNGEKAINSEVVKAFTDSMTLNLELRRHSHCGIVRRMEEHSMGCDTSTRDFPMPSRPNWASSLWKRFGIRTCCSGNALVTDDQTGADRSHDIDVLRAQTDEKYTQPV
eukprot:CAMPEP_0172689460 /NCGR_PEP_ID=MMETSP1074-20121228/23156_1 /TAXON_ID=2916 /ORGANISM="Ceratium fusus, Strain PA161109" /LENGTH=481 /DNA_ID=CAMNT_0013509267 /DNA_START=57 /DNA_END=1502 /DNA_ORIENTATION=-